MFALTQISPLDIGGCSLQKISLQSMPNNLTAFFVMPAHFFVFMRPDFPFIHKKYLLWWGVVVNEI